LSIIKVVIHVWHRQSTIQSLILDCEEADKVSRLTGELRVSIHDSECEVQTSHIQHTRQLTNAQTQCSAQCLRCIATCRMWPFAGAIWRVHGTLLVVDCRGDIGGLCAGLGNATSSALPPDDIYTANSSLHFTALATYLSTDISITFINKYVLLSCVIKVTCYNLGYQTDETYHRCYSSLRRVITVTGTCQCMNMSPVTHINSAWRQVQKLKGKQTNQPSNLQCHSTSCCLAFDK